MIVIDASVIVKLAKREKGTDRVMILKEKHVKGEEKIVVPFLLFYEVANALRYAKELPNEEVSNFLSFLDELDFEVIELGVKDIIKATLLAREKDITVYDAIYGILALNFGCKFVTADKKLYEKIKDLNFMELL